MAQNERSNEMQNYALKLHVEHLTLEERKLNIEAKLRGHGAAVLAGRGIVLPDLPDLPPEVE